MSKRTLVTAALPYANGPIHIGHLAGVYVPSDMYVRYKRLRGEEVLFICGSDEHGVPITISADKEKVSPQVIVDRYHELNGATFKKLGIEFDYYGRTSSPEHRTTSQEFFSHLQENGYIEPKTEPQFYDQEAKMFLPDRYVEGTCPVCSNPDARGDQCDRCGTYLNQTELINPRSKVTGTTPVVRDTEHWYFKLSAFQGELEKYIEDKAGKWRDAVVQQARSWLKGGLQDRPITRDLDWGVPVPNAPGKVLYVWFDAPIGYVTATKEHLPNDWKKWWAKDENLDWVCFLGKDNIVFHTIMFPAMELAYSKKGDFTFQLPTQIPANEFMNLEGRKLSKSRGWTIEPHEILDRYDSDIIRYTIACNLPESKDSDFSWKDLQAHTNNELADILGNYANRVLTFAKNNFNGKVPNKFDYFEEGGDASLGERPASHHLFEFTFKDVRSAYEGYRLREATSSTMNLARLANKFFDDQKPWKVIKENKALAASIIKECLELLRIIAFAFQPIIPNTSKKILNALPCDDSLLAEYGSDQWGTAFKERLKVGAPLGELPILFTKLEDEQIEGELKRMEEMAAKAEQQVVAAPAPTNQKITIDDFKKIKLKTAVVVEAEKVPKSKKLLKLQITVGDEKRQIVAGIAEKYSPEDLVGKTIVIVANLEPAKLMGIESQGMLLAVNDEKGVVTLVGPDSEALSGLEVR